MEALDNNIDDNDGLDAIMDMTETQWKNYCNYVYSLETQGLISSTCQTCAKVFYPHLRRGKKLTDIFAPGHKPSSRCESGKRPHCTCDVCF